MEISEQRDAYAFMANAISFNRDALAFAHTASNVGKQSWVAYVLPGGNTENYHFRLKADLHPSDIAEKLHEMGYEGVEVFTSPYATQARFGDQQQLYFHKALDEETQELVSMLDSLLLRE